MFPLDTTTRAGRMMEAGRVTVTFRSERTGEHITLLAKARGKDENDRWVGCPLAEALVVFIEVPNQEGWNDKVGKVTRRAGFVPDSRADEARVFCARKLLDFVAGRPMPAGLEVFEESRCGRCGRQLTDPVSIERGIGPECYGKQTGSKHETKGSPSAPAVEIHGQLDARHDRMNDQARIDADEAAYNRDFAARELAQERAAFASDLDLRSAPSASVARVVPPGTWRQRKAFVQEELQLERENAKRGYRRQLQDKADRPSAQNLVYAATGSAIPY